jgi:hypothetical protein
VKVFQTMPINITLPADQFFTLGGRIACKQCQAKSKRTKQQCRAPAMRGKQVCKNHGGKSTGPKTIEGRKRCSAARTVHGRDTIAIRKERSLASARLAVLESAGAALNMFTGSRSTGTRPSRMVEAYPELQEVVREIVRS